MTRQADPRPQPHVLDLPPGEYRWCACGRSGQQPFCDGSHAGTGVAPVPLQVLHKVRTVWLCGCKRTRTPPHCDGSHNRLRPQRDCRS